MRFEFHPGVYVVRLSYNDWRAVYECFRESVNPWSDDEAEMFGCIEHWTKSVIAEKTPEPWEDVEFPLPATWLRLLTYELATGPDTDGWGHGHDELLLNLYGQVAAQNRRKRQLH